MSVRTIDERARVAARGRVPAQMRAAVFTGDGGIAVQRVEVPRPQAGQVLVRLEGCGVCASNYPVWAGKPWFEYPFAAGAPGHEGWGRIAALGEGVDGWSTGERVALLSGAAYAEYDVAAADQLARLPDALAGQDVPGEPLACAINIFRRSGIEAGMRVAVVGVGFIGAMLVQLVTHAGAEVIALSRRAHALRVARACGAAQAIATEDQWEAIRRVQALTGERGCERVIEAAGEQATLDMASALVATGGRLVIAGYHQEGPRQVDMQSWNWRGIDVVNAHERDMAVVAAGMREGVAAVADGRLRLAPLLTHRFPLERLGEAFEAMRDRPDGFLKAVVCP